MATLLSAAGHSLNLDLSTPEQEVVLEQSIRLHPIKNNNPLFVSTVSVTDTWILLPT